MSSKDECIKWLVEAVSNTPGWDGKPLSLAHEIMGFLEQVKDGGTSIDSGTGNTEVSLRDGNCETMEANLWVKVQGVEYFLSIRKSNNQLVSEGKLKAAE